MSMSSGKRSRPDAGSEESDTYKQSRQDTGSTVDEQQNPGASGRVSSVVKQSNGNRKGPPNEFQVLTQDALEAVTRVAHLVEPQEKTKTRKYIVEQLNMIVRICFEAIMKNAGYSEQAAREAGGFVTTFGSYKLDVHSPDSDIDAVCVAPYQISREKCFNALSKLLRNLSEVDHVRVLNKAFVPVIKFRMLHIDVDLLFARLELPAVGGETTHFSVNSPLVFRAAVHDLKSVLSLNGCRVASALSRMVPSRAVFRGLLRYVKAWARARGIYGNVLGYLGGINCAIMAARVCQLYPSSSQPELVVKFFQLYAHWTWPTPVLLSRIQQDMPHAPPEEAELRRRCSLPPYPPTPTFRVWDPQCQEEPMPLITPVCPSMNSAHNVSDDTLRRINNEVQRAARLLNRLNSVQTNSIAAGERDPQYEFDTSAMDLKDPLSNAAATLHAFSSVILPIPFLFQYRDFLVVEATSTSDSEFHKQWIGYLETKLRHFVESICLLNKRGESPVRGYLCTTPFFYSTDQEQVQESPEDTDSFEETLKLGAREHWPLLRPCEMDSDPSYNGVTHVTRYLVGLHKESLNSENQSSTIDLGEQVKKFTSSLAEFTPPDDPDSSGSATYDIDVTHRTQVDMLDDYPYKRVVRLMKNSLHYEKLNEITQAT